MTGPAVFRRIAIILALASGFVQAQPPASEHSPPAPNRSAKKTPSASPRDKGTILVKGQITDSAGGAMAGVKVSLHKEGGDRGVGELIAESMTDDLGDFKLQGADPLSGPVVVTMTKEHFAPLVQSLTLLPGNPAPFLGETMEGNLALTGQVVDAKDQTPVPGAQVELSSANREWPAETDDDGRFAVGGLPPGSVEVTVDAPGYGRRRRMVKSLIAGVEISFALKPQRVLRLKVVNEEGVPLPGVTVDLVEPAQNDQRTATTDDQGTVSFSGLDGDAQALYARLTHADYLSAESFNRTIPFPPDLRELNHELFMIRAAQATGVVRDGEGQPLNGARIMATGRYSGAARRAWSDAEGRFTITGLAAGPTLLTVHRSGFAPELKIVEVQRGPSAVADFELRPGRVIQGMVKDDHGTVLPDTNVSTGAWRGQGTLGLQTVTDAHGRFSLSDLPNDEFSISVHTPPRAPTTRQVPAGGNQEIDFVTPYIPEWDKHLEGAHIAVGDPAPMLTLRTVENETLDLHKQEGKTILIYFWASWCGTCRQEMPKYIKLYEKYSNRPGFLMVGINRDQEEKEFRQFIEKNPLPWKQVHGEDNGATLAFKEFGATTYPSFYVIGPNGKVAGTRLYGADLEALLSDLLANKQTVIIKPVK